MIILSWNVNGIRAAHKKGALAPLFRERPDITCLQEIKALREQVPDEIHNFEGYHKFYNPAEKKGYSGTALFTIQKPREVKYGFGVKKFDTEGRVIIAEYEKFMLYNIYFPNGKSGPARLKYKMDFYGEFLRRVEKEGKKGKKIVVCGDVNTAHKEIDLARPKENAKISGFLPEERAFLDKFISKGYIDTFREFNSEAGHYTWWDMMTRARERDVGWRIDYFYISKNLREKLKNAFIFKNIMGSDHCPIGIELDI